jgi:hypothetical protein
MDKRCYQDFLGHPNDMYANTKSTMELEENGALPFLDVLVKKKDRWHTQPHGILKNYTFTLVSACRLRAPSLFHCA